MKSGFVQYDRIEEYMVVDNITVGLTSIRTDRFQFFLPNNLVIEFNGITNDFKSYME